MLTFEELAKCVFRVESADNKNRHFGTAFAFHTDKTYTYLLTCSHVIRDVGGWGNAIIGGRTAEVVREGKAVDITVLRVARLSDLPSVVLARQTGEAGGFFASGFSSIGSELRTKHVRGTFGDSFHAGPRAAQIWQREWELIVDGDNLIEPGLSGSPVFSDRGECVAIVRQEMDAGKRGVALCVGVLRDIYPELPDSILPNRPQTEPSKEELRQSLRMNLTDEISEFTNMVRGINSNTRVICIWAHSGMGKTRLLDEYERISARNHVTCARFNLVQQISIENFLIDIASHFGGLSGFRKFTKFREGSIHEANISYYRAMGANFLSDVRHKKKRVVVLIDQFEKADQVFIDWFLQDFVPEIAPMVVSQLSQELLVVVAGQVAPRHLAPRPAIREFYLKLPTQDCWKDYLKACGIDLDWKSAEDLYNQYQGLPFALSICATTLRFRASAD